MAGDKPDLPSSASPAAAAPRQINIEEVVEGWAADLIGNVPQLRDTDAYNKFRNSITDLKNKLQP